MRDTPSTSGERPAAGPAPIPVQTAGHRSGEGSASVLPYLVHDRLRSAEKNAQEKRPRD